MTQQKAEESAPDEGLLRFVGGWANHLAQHLPVVAAFRSHLLSIGGLEVSFPTPFSEAEAATLEKLLQEGCLRAEPVEVPKTVSPGLPTADPAERIVLNGYVLKADGIWSPRRWEEVGAVIREPEPGIRCYFGVAVPKATLRKEAAEARRFRARFDASHASALEQRQTERRIAGPQTVMAAIEEAGAAEEAGRWDEAERWYVRAVRLASGESRNDHERSIAHAQYTSFLLRRGRVSVALPLLRDLLRVARLRCSEDPLMTLLFRLPPDQAKTSVRRLLVGDVPLPPDLEEAVRRLRRRGRESVAEALERAAQGREMA